MQIGELLNYFHSMIKTNKLAFLLVFFQGIIIGIFLQNIITEKIPCNSVFLLLISLLLSLFALFLFWIGYSFALSKIILGGLSRGAIYEILEYDAFSYSPFTISILIGMFFKYTGLITEYNIWFVLIGLIAVLFSKVVIYRFNPPNKEIYQKEKAQQVKIKHVSTINDIPADKSFTEKCKVSKNVKIRKYIINDEIRNAINLKNPKTGILKIKKQSSFDVFKYAIGWNAKNPSIMGNLKLYIKHNDKEKLIFNKDTENILGGWNEYQILSEKNNEIEIKWENTINDDIYLSVSDITTVKPKNKKKNILVIVFDGIRPETIGLFNDKPKSDNISTFFKDSLIFKNSFAQGEWTMPDLVSIATSLYPSHHGVNDPDLYSTSISTEIKTMAEVLQENGYNTFGYTSHNRVSPGYGHARGYNRFLFRCTLDEFTKRRTEKENSKKSKKDVKITDIQKVGNNNVDIVFNTIKFLKGNPETNNFVFLHVFDTHQPFFQSPFNVSTKEAVYNKVTSTELSKKELGEEGFEFLRELYQQKFKEIDDNISILLDYILKYENDCTTIILTSDHGTILFDETAKNMLPPGKDGRNRYLVETRLKSPFLIRIPDGKQKNNIRNDPIEGNISIMPTVLEIAKLNPPKNIDGISALGKTNKKYSKGYTITESNYKDIYELLLRTPKFTYLLRTNRNREKKEILIKPGTEIFYNTNNGKKITDNDAIKKIKTEVKEILKNNHLSNCATDKN